ncbi:PaaX family transcriptional regulator C-terminal domain-containing protein [Paractinoplanes ferrugineus]|uniref:PaaX family transcriptional regulator n=1 Tax=Paractinoplanes ferrugineus TaxID=113564 RepID=A0A919J5K9_9ACTN|nr:PaaX family transcriptional regulator C-terminal domain-containing protein [Actinoplanes ferrugineus]GIE14300.1 PaaX family transcriptional regulator [Actinoplanes ferrugineus]
MSADDLRLPRSQAGSSPQHLLATVLGEYLNSTEAGLPSPAVIAILAEFGVSEAGARSALSRLTRRGLLAMRGRGRSPVYHVTASAFAHHRWHMQRFLNFGAHPPRWTGDWVTVSYSIPSAGQATRHAVRKSLAGLRFAGLYDSVWIRPGSDAGPVRAVLRELLGPVPGARWSVMHARFDEEAGPHGPAAAYDLAGLAGAYTGFAERFAALRAEVRAGTVDAARALVARTSVMDAWRRFPEVDPDLPAHLLPPSWPRPRARATFLDIHAALGSPARARLIEVTTPYWPAAADWIIFFAASTDPANPAPVGPQH